MSSTQAVPKAEAEQPQKAAKVAPPKVKPEAPKKPVAKKPEAKGEQATVRVAVTVTADVEKFAKLAGCEVSAKAVKAEIQRQVRESVEAMPVTITRWMRDKR
jgi:hypothetical protein